MEVSRKQKQSWFINKSRDTSGGFLFLAPLTPSVDPHFLIAGQQHDISWISIDSQFTVN